MKWLVGTGVSVSSIFYIRNILDKSGWKKVKIVASSGFNPEKCLLFANTNAPVDVIGTGSYIPNNWEETYATADIIKYGEKNLVKKGREFLIQE
jgi:nicotinate phosphoribosyltransferase